MHPLLTNQFSNIFIKLATIKKDVVAKSLKLYSFHWYKLQLQLDVG